MTSSRTALTCHVLAGLLLMACSLDAAPIPTRASRAPDAGAWAPPAAMSGSGAPAPRAAAAGSAGPAARAPLAQAGASAAVSGSAAAAGSSGNAAGAPAMDGPLPDEGPAPDAAPPPRAVSPTAGAAASGGTGGQAGRSPIPDSTAAAGAAGSEPATAEPDDLPNALLDAVVAVLTGEAPREAPQLPTAQGPSGLSAELVKPLLGSLFFSGTCFGNAPACFAACLVIAQDCRPCMADEECRSALQLVCGDPQVTCAGP